MLFSLCFSPKFKAFNFTCVYELSYFRDVQLYKKTREIQVDLIEESGHLNQVSLERFEKQLIQILEYDLKTISQKGKADLEIKNGELTVTDKDNQKLYDLKIDSRESLEACLNFLRNKFLPNHSNANLPELNQSLLADQKGEIKVKPSVTAKICKMLRPSCLG